MEWHVWGPNDTEPTVYHDPILLQAALAAYATTDIVMVRSYKRLEAGSQWYNGPGGASLPKIPANPPQREVITITHVKKKG